MREITTYYTRNGVVPQPRDFADSPAELLAYDGGTPVTLSGTVVEPGRMRFDVPPGTYVVKLSATRYVVTSERWVDINDRRFGRPDRGGNPIEVPIKLPAPLELTGLQPTHAPGTLGETTLGFSSLDIEETGSLEPSRDFTDGQTTLSDPDATYTTYYGTVPRFDAAQGDSVWVLQYEGRDAGEPMDAGLPWKSESLVAAAHLDPYTFDGGSLSLTATFSAVPQRTAHVEWHREDFNALRTVSATSGRSDTYFEFYPMLRDPRDGWIDYSVSPLHSFYTGLNGPQTLVTRDIPYGLPYPAAWEPVAYFSHSYSFTQPNHDGSRSVSLSETATSFLTLSSLASQPSVRPNIGMPQGLKVEGQPAFPSRLLETTTPLVTWEAPFGTPSDYVLAIRRHNTTAPTRILVARIYLPPEHRSVRIPPGLLTAGNTYSLELLASHADPQPPGQLPSMRYVIPFDTATTVSGLLTVP